MNTVPFSREVARRSGSNFYYSFFFLSPEKRDAILAIYAFSRLVDDAVDEATDEAAARQEIETWKERLLSCYEPGVVTTDVPHPLLPELKMVIERFQIPKEYFVDLLKGVEMDLSKKRYTTFSELETYCYHVAGTIGLLCNHLFGLSGKEGRDYAITLGTAFQLTNILRDVGVDLQLSRVYLPHEDLKKYGVNEEDLQSSQPSENLKKLFAFEAERAWKYFEKSEKLLSRDVRRKILPAAIMSSFYQKILKKIQNENYPVLKKKVSLAKWEKMFLLAKTLVTSL